jgi:hypothetical protein
LFEKIYLMYVAKTLTRLFMGKSQMEVNDDLLKFIYLQSVHPTSYCVGLLFLVDKTSNRPCGISI